MDRMIRQHACCSSRRAFLRGAGALGMAAALSGLRWTAAEAQSGEVRLTWYGQDGRRGVSPRRACLVGALQ